MHRSFTDDFMRLNEKFNIYGEDYNHICKSLRMKIGECLEIVGENGCYICEIENIETDHLTVMPIEKCKKSSESEIDIVLYQALAKGEKMDWIIQKAVELGIREIYPINTLRTIVKLDDKRKEKRIQRFNAIAKEASKQSRRDDIPVVNDIIDLKDIDEENLLVAYENEEKNTLKKYLEENKPKRIGLVIGPEGGFDPSEIEYLLDKKAAIISLGPRILRTETAAIVLTSIIQYELGDMGE
ncbi:RsmE family RNA methyltransferase [Microaceticoccus formicicus]|uniref:RsmE family RNA methyltransferase n=1 Tax=Microaceticoccus formicicus TaxID=3118105 RepID=UPI003CD04931|nr:RsmE family RNA methyltransferase [Peptoniphilaceae bacterium AMB_02]